MKPNHEIDIPQDALEATIQHCACELQDVYEKQNRSLFELLFRFLCLDLQTYLKIAFVGLGGTIGICLMLSQSSTIPFSIYAAILGCLNLYECYKVQKYQMTELCTPVYLNQGKVFLYKNASIAILEVCIFIVFTLFADTFMQISMMRVILSSLLPLFISQIILLHFVTSIHRMYEAFALYVLLFSGYLFGYYYFETTILHGVTPLIVVSLFVVLLAIFIVDLYKIKNFGKEGIYGISSRTS